MHRIIGHWHQQPYEKFQAPEFYKDGVLVKVISGNHVIEVRRDGEALLNYEHKDVCHNIVSPDDFRQFFYDGILPADDQFYTWENNAWFDLYDSKTGEHLDEVVFTWQEAFDKAVYILGQCDQEKSDA